MVSGMVLSFFIWTSVPFRTSERVYVYVYSFVWLNAFVGFINVVDEKHVIKWMRKETKKSAPVPFIIHLRNSVHWNGFSMGLNREITSLNFVFVFSRPKFFWRPDSRSHESKRIFINILYYRATNEFFQCLFITILLWWIPNKQMNKWKNWKKWFSKYLNVLFFSFLQFFFLASSTSFLSLLRIFANNWSIEYHNGT